MNNLRVQDHVILTIFLIAHVGGLNLSNCLLKCYNGKS